MGKIALVLGGGGMKGAYELGVWKALRELGVNPDIITGTSIGALNGALMVQDEYEFACELWEAMCYDMIFSEPDHREIEAVNNRLQLIGLALKDSIWCGGLDVTPFRNLIAGKLDEDRFHQSPIDFGLVTTRIISKEIGLLGSKIPTIQRIEVMKKDIPRGEMADYLMASAACYPIFKPQKIGDYYHLDGGYSDDLPIRLAMRSAPEEIIAVDLESLGLKNIYVPQNVRFRYIRSRWNLGELFCFQKDIVHRNIAVGYYDCFKEFGKLEGMAYSFHLGEVAKLVPDFVKKERAKLNLAHLEPLFKDREGLLNKVRGKVNNLVMPQEEINPILRMAEAAAKIFYLPPDKVYTAEEFNSKILEGYFESVERISGIEKEGLFSIATEIIKSSDMQLMVAALVHLTKVEGLDYKGWQLLNMLPNVVMASLYILEILAE